MNLKIPKPIRFECQPDCAACCQLGGGFVYVSETEIKRIAAYLKMDEAEFIENFIRQADEKTALVDGENEACIMLENNTCLIYPERPEQCRTFPFWPENLKTKQRWELTCQICPGIGKGRVFTEGEIRAVLNGKPVNSKIGEAL